jgi:small multidrug resistance pump
MKHHQLVCRTAPPARRAASDAFRAYRPWLWLAAAYNLFWGSISVLWPSFWFKVVGLPPPVESAPWQGIGMMVMLFAPGYFWAARAPERHGHLVLMGMVGKLLGPVGFLWAATSGTLPLRYGWMILANDLFWWPAFLGFLRMVVARSGGWKRFLAGD